MPRIPFIWSYHNQPEGYGVWCEGCSFPENDVVHYYEEIVIAHGFPGDYSREDPFYDEPEISDTRPIRFLYRDRYGCDNVGFVWVSPEGIGRFRNAISVGPTYTVSQLEADNNHFIEVISRRPLGSPKVSPIEDPKALKEFKDKMSKEFKNLRLLK